MAGATDAARSAGFPEQIRARPCARNSGSDSSAASKRGKELSMQRVQAQRQRGAGSPATADGAKGTKIITNNNSSTNDNTAPTTPVRKTRRGKRGGRGRSISPRASHGCVGGTGGAGVSSSIDHDAAGALLPNHRRYASSHSPSMPMSFLRRQHQQHEETLGAGPLMGAECLPSAVSADWGNQGDNRGARMAAGGGVMYCGFAEPRHSRPAAESTSGLGNPSPRESASVMAGRVRGNLDDLAYMLSDFSERGASLSAIDVRRANDKLKSAFYPLVELQRIITEELIWPASRLSMPPSTLPQVPEDARFQHLHHSSLAHGRELIPGMLSPWETEPTRRPRCRAKKAAQSRGEITRPNRGVAAVDDSGWPGERSATGVVGRGVASGGAGAFQQTFSGEPPEGPRPVDAAGYFGGGGGAAAATATPRPGPFRPLQIEIGDGVISAPPSSDISSTTNAFLSSPEDDSVERWTGRRRARVNNGQMEGFAGLTLAADLGPRFAGQTPSRLPKEPALEIMQGEHDLSQYCLQDEEGPGTEVTGIQPTASCRTSTRNARSNTTDGGGGVRGRIGAEREDRSSETVGMPRKGRASDNERVAHPQVIREEGDDGERRGGNNDDCLKNATDGNNGGATPAGYDEQHGCFPPRGIASEWLSPAPPGAEVRQQVKVKLDYERQSCRAHVHSSATPHLFSTESCTRDDRSGGAAGGGVRTSNTNDTQIRKNDQVREGPRDTEGFDRPDGCTSGGAATARGAEGAGDGGNHAVVTSPPSYARSSDTHGKQSASSRARTREDAEVDDYSRGSTAFFPETNFAPGGAVRDRGVRGAVGDEGSHVWTDDSPGPSPPIFATISPTGFSAENVQDDSDVGTGRLDFGSTGELVFIGAGAPMATPSTQSAWLEQGQPRAECYHVPPGKGPHRHHDAGDGGHLSGSLATDAPARFGETRPTETGNRPVSTKPMSGTLGCFQQQQHQQHQHQHQHQHQRIIRGTVPPVVFGGEAEISPPPSVVIRNPFFPTGVERSSPLSPKSPPPHNEHEGRSQPPLPTTTCLSEGLCQGPTDHREPRSGDRENHGSSAWKGSVFVTPPQHQAAGAREPSEGAGTRVAKDQEEKRSCGVGQVKDGAVERLQRNARHRLVGGAADFVDGSMLARATIVDQGGPTTFRGALDASTSRAEGKGHSNEGGGTRIFTR